MQKTRISPFPTIKLVFLGVFIAVMLVPATMDNIFAQVPAGVGGGAPAGVGGGAPAGVGGGAPADAGRDLTSPKADITYSVNGPYRVGNSFTITATFDESLRVNSLPKITFSGVTITTLQMTKVSATVYTIDYSVDFNKTVSVKISLSGATDTAGNDIQSTPNSGGTFDVLKKSSDKSTSPPKFTSSSITTTGGPNGGFGGILNSLDNNKREIHKDEFVTLRLDLDENFGKFHTQNLYFGEIDNVVSMSSNYLVHVKYHNGQIEIDDPTEFFSEVKVMSTSFDGKEILFFDLKPARPYHEVDVGIYSWNENHQFVREMTKNAFSIVEKIKTAEPGSIEIGNIEMKKTEHYKGGMQKQVSSNEHFEPFLIEQKSNAFFEIESQEIIPKLEAKYSQWSEGMISDKEFVEFLAFGIKQKLQDVDTQDPTHSELSNLLSWSTLISNTLEDKNSEKTSMVIDGAYQYMRASLE